ncbi:MAG TPA: ABC transporter permease [Anaerolineae bacterium]|nr:ABC transporter permease [Anaerolineae bacterium]
MNPFRFSHVAWNDLRHARLRSLLTVAGVGVIVAVFVTLSAIAGGLGSVIAATPASARNLVLIDKGATDYCQGQIPTAIVDVLRRWPGVARVVPMLHTAIRWKGQMLLVRAIQPDEYAEMSGMRIVQGKPLRRGRTVMAGEQLARQNGWQVGDTLELAGERLKLVGIFSASGMLNSEVWTSLEDGQRLLSRGDSYSAIVIQSAPDTDVKALRDKLVASSIVARETDVGTEPEVYETMNRSLQQVSRVMNAISALALIAIAFGVYNVVGMTVAEKSHEIAILKAIGLSAHQVTGIYVQEGLIQAGLGYAVGMLAGASTLTYLNATSAVSFLAVPLTLRLSPEIALAGGGMTILLTLASAWLAARRAAAAPVAEVLRGA